MLELYIDDMLTSLNNLLSNLSRDTPFEYWLLNPTGQINTVLMTAALGILIWLLYIEYSIRNLMLTAASNAPAVFPEEEDIFDDDGSIVERPSSPPCASSSPPPERHITFKRSETPSPEPLLPTMRQLAPPGHRPTNAQLNITPFRVAQPLGPRTGRVTNPGYQTPFKHKSGKPTLARAFPTRAPILNDNSPFGLAKDALDSCPTLQGNGMLKADGTPNIWTSLKYLGHFAKFTRKEPVSY